MHTLWMDNSAKRLVKAREAKGYASAAEAADALGFLDFLAGAHAGGH